MKKLIYTLVSVVIVGGLLAVAVVVHHNKKVQAQAATTSLHEQLQTLRVQATEQVTQLQTAMQTEQQKAAADKQALCAFIVSHKLAAPTVCSQ